MKKKIENLFEVFIPILLGLTVGSLVFYDNDTWKNTLPALLAVMALQRIFDKYNK